MQRVMLGVLLVAIGFACVGPVGGQDRTRPREALFDNPSLAYQEALRRIEAARIWGKTELYLYDLSSLDRLPPEIGQLTHLKIFDLSGTALTTLPPEIGQLVSLEELGLRYTISLAVLPPEIGSLSHLKVLEVESWVLKSLPSELFHLTSLEVLTFSNTGIPAIPHEIGDLKDLKWLAFASDHSAGLLTELPPEIEQLEHLQSLWLYGNKFTVFPPQIFNLPKLEQLSLFFNPLAEIPLDIGKLTSLQYLDLSHIQIQTLPPEIGNLTLLETLNLGGNEELTELPVEIGHLSHLQKLDITGTGIAKLPIGLGHLTQSVSIESNALTFPPSDIVAQGTPAILAYLRDYEAILMRQTIAAIAVGVGAIAGVILLFRWRQKRSLTEKKKRA